ncbi:LysR family transcriptional regulator [Undibacterium luofuense]|uniref:LysR family transcriptional regulator n=1 Tax=Undibacterium luofuense TaxID=2828733 RepID=UPI0030ED3703
MKIENISDLRVLLATARQGSLSAAARELEITPAAASAMLKRLEQQLGARLFVRSTRALRLTSEGELLLNYARRALELLEEGITQVGVGTTHLSGHIRVAAPSDLSRHWLLPWFDQFMEMHPQVSIALTVSDKLQDLHRDALDLAIRYGELADSGLVARLLADFPRIRLRVHEAYSGQVEDWVGNGRIEVALFNRYRRGAVRGAEIVARTDMVLVGPKGHPLLRTREVPFRALGGVAMCGPLKPNGLTTVMAEQAARLGIELNMVLEGSSSLVLREAVARCGLVTVLPRPFVERELSPSVFGWARVVKPSVEQITWLAVGTQRPATLAARTVARLVRQILSAR